RRIVVIAGLPRCHGDPYVYMSDAGIGEAIREAAAMAKAANADALYCSDPVIGDVGRGVFVRPGIPEFMRDKAVPSADIVTPNHFELEFLSGVSSKTLGDVKRAMAVVQGSGPRVMLVTSVETDETPSDSVDLVAGEGGRFWRVRTPKLSLSVNGAGDAISALFLVH